MAVLARGYRAKRLEPDDLSYESNFGAVRARRQTYSLLDWRKATKRSLLSLGTSAWSAQALKVENYGS